MNDQRFGRWNAVTFHKTLGKDLARFQTSGGSVGTEYGNPGLAKTISNAGGNGRLRAENDQVDAFSKRAVRQPLAVGRGNLPVCSTRRRPRISRRGKNRLTGRRLREPPRERIFARAVTDDENSHALLPLDGSRRF